MKKHLIWISLITAGTAAVATTHLLGQVAQEQSGQGRQEYTLPQQLPGPIVDTHQLMDLFNKPLYQFLRAEMQKDLGQQTEWDTIVDRGLQTAEVMNLVAIRPRREGQVQAWTEHARTVQAAGIELARAAKQHDPQETRAAYENLIGGCNACHQTFAPDHAPQLMASLAAPPQTSLGN